MKKKIVTLLLAGCMALSITACGGGDNGKKVESQKEVSAEQKEQKEEKPSEDNTTGEIVEENGLKKRASSNKQRIKSFRRNWSF